MWGASDHFNVRPRPGNFCNIPSGLVQDRFGTRTTVALGVLVSFVGYGLLWLVATERLAAPYPAVSLNARVTHETVPRHCDTPRLGGCGVSLADPAFSPAFNAALTHRARGAGLRHLGALGQRLGLVRHRRHHREPHQPRGVPRAGA